MFSNLSCPIDTAMGPNPVEEFPMNAVGVQVSSGTVGIIGMGDIGFKVAKRALAFDMKILYYNRNRRTVEDEAAVGATYCQLNELLRQSDFVVITCSLTSETDGMIGKDQFSMMKPTATIVNLSRGKVIDQDAMVDALKANRIRGAALDVSTPEPLPRDHPLLKLSNVILTPHQGSATDKTRRNMERLMIDNVLAGIEGKPLPNEVKLK
ncbi:glyoxylate reductase/hydroxypyruvate reductase-like isoform X2 [Lineus longissimus]|uniref:glyoxylate reductase/hydroxypyruvate reductase-like isoform X2 n=1 Tax=Lineus longissimus TaxID=88925 RepID=UPI00315C6958